MNDKDLTWKVTPPFDPREAVRFLTETDPRLGQLIARSIEFEFEMDPLQSPYDALLEAIVYQSISGKAAKVIFERIKALSADGRSPSPEEILRLRRPVLRRAGLSGAKVDAVKDLARKTMEGVVPTLEQAHAMSDRELVEKLISVRGIGAWTVEMFLIFRLGRPDVLPVHDYGVLKGFALTYGKKRIPTPRELTEYGERWRPYRTVASWYMWRAVQLAGKDARKINKNSGKKKIVRKKRGRPASRRKK
ncbi:MAG: DNA-3-methyladenine glycosylase 2 family protein [Acidobacteriota bacterium]|nr:DNA-3-methyladenine glycosylase 2 family protein [Acidobacteriota bacterium]